MMTMTNFVFDKTDLGREELATRKYGLALRLRSLLAMIDGKKTSHELLQKVSGLGLNDESIVELIDREFIEPIEEVATNITSLVVQSEAVIQTSAEAIEPVAVSNTSEIHSVSEVEKILSLKKFFNDTIKALIGLRGFSLQLKVERAGTVNELRDLRQIYYDAILKAKGLEMACSVLGRLDLLLGDGKVGNS